MSILRAHYAFRINGSYDTTNYGLNISQLRLINLVFAILARGKSSKTTDNFSGRRGIDLFLPSALSQCQAPSLFLFNEIRPSFACHEVMRNATGPRHFRPIFIDYSSFLHSRGHLRLHLEYSCHGHPRTK